MQITIDRHAGLCTGVNRAIKLAEDYLKKHKSLYCLGEIVHNQEEIKRLKDKGLIIINREKFEGLKNTHVLIRAHGEPPSTYDIAKKNTISLIDGSCPIVVKFQQQLADVCEKHPHAQIVLFGKKNHAEIIGLKGQINCKTIIIETEEDITQIDFTKAVFLFSQTTMNKTKYLKIQQVIKKNIDENKHPQKGHLVIHNTICKQVLNRDAQLTQFAASKDIIVFVSGENSSNGKYLYSIAKEVLHRSAPIHY